MKKSALPLVKSAMIAAVYAVLCIAMAPFTYGSVQIRVSEALTLLPVLTPEAIPGVVLGCALANAIGAAMGANILGAADVVIGTLATLLAALATRALRGVRIKGVPFAAALPPVLLNALFIGGELTYVICGGWNAGIFAFEALSVGLGELVSCALLGLPMIRFIEKHSALNRFFESD